MYKIIKYLYKYFLRLAHSNTYIHTYSQTVFITFLILYITRLKPDYSYIFIFTMRFLTGFRLLTGLRFLTDKANPLSAHRRVSPIRRATRRAIEYSYRFFSIQYNTYRAFIKHYFGSKPKYPSHGLLLHIYILYFYYISFYFSFVSIGFFL